MQREEIIEFLTSSLNKINNNLGNNPKVLFDFYTKRFKNKHLLNYIDAIINRDLHEPWISINELKTLYPKSEIKISKTQKGNKYYQIDSDNSNIRVYSSVIHGHHYYDNDLNLYVEIKFQYLDNSGNEIIKNNYDIDYILKINILGPYMLLRMEDPQYNINDKIIESRLINDSILMGKVIIE